MEFLFKLRKNKFLLYYFPLILLILVVCNQNLFPQSWSPLGSGMNTLVRALYTYNNDLIAGGNFTTAGGNNANYIAKWNGTSWSVLGSGMNNRVDALTIYNGELIAGGNFYTAGGNNANNVAKWNGMNWTNIEAGLNSYVLSLFVYNGQLIAGGDFTMSGGTTVNYIARWGTTGIKLINSNVPEQYKLFENYPNPFNNSTNIKFQIPQTEDVKILLFDITGKEITTLVNNRLKEGTYQICFDAINITSGVYLYRLQTNNYTETKKMILIK